MPKKLNSLSLAFLIHSFSGLSVCIPTTKDQWMRRSRTVASPSVEMKEITYKWPNYILFLYLDPNNFMVSILQKITLEFL